MIPSPQIGGISTPGQRHWVVHSWPLHCTAANPGGSHCSLPSKTLLPHWPPPPGCSVTQATEQPSPFTAFPSSHSSEPSCNPLPQKPSPTRQTHRTQVSPIGQWGRKTLASHSSPSSNSPLPHRLGSKQVQAVLQLSPLEHSRPGSLHSSPGLMIPFPQTARAARSCSKNRSN